ncbi:OmpA family protein [Achromobacter sp. NPDC058515]|uniref:OmpA family protein n=1 Tax=Achromobacter sp. NPDC058515 TaxID=3346533 RepID=UPI0036562E3D
MFRVKNFLSTAIAGFVLFAVHAGLDPQAAEARTSMAAFGQNYVPVTPATSEQAQLVYFRDGAAGQDAPGANVYIDGEYHTTLLPGGFTVICLAPGDHTLGAFENDAPLYRGKTDLIYRATVTAGDTYFVAAGRGKEGAPVPVSRADAERGLVNAREQIHVVSRASTVQPCQNPAGQLKTQDLILSSDVLFAFNKSAYRDITAEGRDHLEELASKLAQRQQDIEEIIVIGHADQIGGDASNMRLGSARAKTVMEFLAEHGVRRSLLSMKSMGSRDPVVTDCEGSRSELIACYAPNRRVVIRINNLNAN